MVSETSTPVTCRGSSSCGREDPRQCLPDCSFGTAEVGRADEGEAEAVLPLVAVTVQVAPEHGPERSDAQLLVAAIAEEQRLGLLDTPARRWSPAPGWSRSRWRPCRPGLAGNDALMRWRPESTGSSLAAAKQFGHDVFGRTRRVVSRLCARTNNRTRCGSGGIGGTRGMHLPARRTTVRSVQNFK
jgi:hypothetical protein